MELLHYSKSALKSSQFETMWKGFFMNIVRNMFILLFFIEGCVSSSYAMQPEGQTAPRVAALALIQHSSYYAAGQYKDIEDILQNDTLTTSERWEALRQRGNGMPIYSARLPETHLLHRAIKLYDDVAVAALLGHYGKKIVAKVGHGSDTLPLVEDMLSYVEPDKSFYEENERQEKRAKMEKIAELIKAYGGRVVRATESIPGDYENVRLIYDTEPTKD